MSTRQQVLNNLFYYVCVYLKNNGETCMCCCPNTTFTFDVIDNELMIHTWNFQTAIPTIEELQAITLEQADVIRKLIFIKNSQSLNAVIIATNQTRALLSLSEMTDEEKIQLIPVSTYFYPLI